VECPTRAGSLAFMQLRGDPNPFIATLGNLAATVFADLKRDISLSLSC
jgi:hypothetical protein